MANTLGLLSALVAERNDGEFRRLVEMPRLVGDALFKMSITNRARVFNAMGRLCYVERIHPEEWFKGIKDRVNPDGYDFLKGI